MNKKIDVTLFISFFTGFSVLLGNISFLPAFADESELVSFTCPSTALGFSEEYVEECYRKGNKKMELQQRRKRERESRKRERESVQYRRNSVNTNINTSATTRDPYRKNADSAAMQRYLMNNQKDSYPFKRTDQTIESERQIDRINHQMRVERGINESRRRQLDAGACLFGDRKRC